MNKLKINRLALVLFTILWVIGTSCATYAERKTGDDFLDSLFYPVEITPIGTVLPIQYSSLNTHDKDNIVSAKEALTQFIRSFKDKDQESLKYLHQPLKVKYENDIDLFRKEFDFPEVILEFRVVNFLLKGEGNKEILLYTVVRTASEGDETDLEKAYGMQKINGAWTITRLSDSIKYWTIEIDR